MVDDGKDHGNDRRNDDEEGSRHYEQRRETQYWRPTNGWFLRLAAGVTALVVIVAFAMKLLGLFGRFTGNNTDIKDNQDAIAELKVTATATQTATAANTQAIAGVVATTVDQQRDIAEIKASLNSMLFVNCAVYARVYAGAPTISECARASGSP